MLNLKARISAARQNDEGFTLIELAVVILIIGILLALALPSFLGVRKNAQHKAAQASVRTALTTAKAIYSDTNTYYTDNATFLAQEPSKVWFWDTTAGTFPTTVPTAPASAKAAADSNEVVIWGNADNFAAVSRSKGNRCYMVIEDNGSALNASGIYWHDSPVATDCKLPASLVKATILTAAGATFSSNSGWTQVTAA